MREIICLAIALASLSTICSAQTLTETFGSGANAFTMDFVTIGNPGNAADTTGSPNPAGSVAYTYNIGKYEISGDQISKANLIGNLGITTYAPWSSGGLYRPATGISWNEAARFVNWLNTSKGYQAAYTFTTSGANDNIALWGAGQFTGSNQYRHKNAYYFLPSIDEWYKAAYYDPNKTGGAGYWDYSTGSDAPPTQVSSGISPGTLVYGQGFGVGPADVNNAGGLSPYGTMAQGGNMYEWLETAEDGLNSSPDEERIIRGGLFTGDLVVSALDDLIYSWNPPWLQGEGAGFRIAMIPEPSSLSLLVLGGVVVALGRRKRA